MERDELFGLPHRKLILNSHFMTNVNLKITTYLFLTVICTGLYGCDRPSGLVETYHETFTDVPRINPESQDVHAFLKMMPQDDIHANLNMNDINMNMSAPIEASMANTPIVWKTPETWNEKPGQGMRVVTFTSKDEANPVETTIVSLAGEAGGLNANVDRWLKQLNLQAESEEQINSFIDQQKSITLSDGSLVKILDFTVWSSKVTDNQSSMIAAVWDAKTAQVFIKMTGSLNAVQKNKALFEALVESLKFK